MEAREYQMRNRLFNCGNPYQGDFKRVLCVCSAGLLRSPTAALVLSQEPYNFNTRACGLDSYALIHIDEVLITWADEIVCMSEEQENRLREMVADKPITCLYIRDDFSYRDPELIQLIKEKYNATI